MNETAQQGNSNGDTEPHDHDDATWILTSAFTIFTMQSGFGLLESGFVSLKNEANIMVKNALLTSSLVDFHTGCLDMRSVSGSHRKAILFVDWVIS